MKLLFATLTIAFSFFTLSSFAMTEEGSIPEAAQQAFNNSFKQASEVSWTINADYYKVAFSLNGQYISAYYHTDGTMMAMTRNLTSAQLPLTLQTGLKARYSDLWISDLFEISDEAGVTSYYVTLENADNKVVLKSSAGTDWSVFQKARKL